MTTLSLARDTLESVKLSPTAAPLWQRLSSVVQALEAPGRTQLIGEIGSLTLSSPAARWLQYSALLFLTRDARWLWRQGALAEAGTGPDAIAVLLNHGWHHALVYGHDRAAFMRILAGLEVIRLQRLAAAALPPYAAQGRAAPEGSGGRALRVALYTPQVASCWHGGTSLMLNMLSLLARAPAEVRVFTAQESSIPACDSYRGGSEAIVPATLKPETLRLHGAGAVELYLPDEALSLRLRLRQMQAAVCRYRPDLVLFVGFMSPLVFRLYRHYPLLGLSVHALPPAVPLDVWLSPDGVSDELGWPALARPARAGFPWRFWPCGHAAPLARAEAGYAATDLLLITAGFRLPSELTAPWRERMLALLAARPEVRWLLIGVMEAQPAQWAQEHPRLHWLAPQTHLERWLAMGDIYVGPPRVGGGGAVAMAMEQGMAVAAFAGTDGGDKVGAAALNGLDDYFAQIQFWCDDAPARRRAGQALRERFHARLDLCAPQAMAGLMQASRQALAMFGQRQRHSGGLCRE